MQVGKLGPSIPVLRDDLGLSLVDAGYALSIFTLLAILLAVPLGAFSTFFGRRSIIVFGDHIRDDWHPWVHGDHAAVDVFGPARA